MDTPLFILAVTILLSSYGGMHYYLYRKLLWVFPGHRKLLIISLYVLAGSLFAVQILVERGWLPLAAPLAWLPSVWMGFVFLFFVIAGLADLLIKGLTMARKNNLLTRVPKRTFTIVTTAVVILVCLAGIYSAQQINIESYTLSSAKLKRPFTIVQVSDLHLGLLSNETHIQDLVNRINSLQPDIIVSTGDLVDMQAENLDGYSATLAGLRARLGKFAVYGNHEIFAGIDMAKEFTERSGFTLLSNRGVSLDNAVNIIGMDDPTVHGKLMTSGERERQVLQPFQDDRFTLLLKHQPVVSLETRGMADLQLSGHTHGGQIVPFNLLVRIFYRAPFGLSQTGPNSWLYVSKGTGTWGPPMRVLAKPEVSVFYLRPGK